MAEILSMISTISFVMACIFAVLSVVLWIVFRIPSIIGDLSGRNAKKSIEQLRLQNLKTGNKAFRPSQTNLDRGKVTATMSDINKSSTIKNFSGTIAETGLLNENVEKQVAYAIETITLDDEDATVPLYGEMETTPLYDMNHRTNSRTSNVQIELLEEVMIVHTNEEVAW